MEEPEVPTEHLHEHIHEHAEGATGKNRWSLYLAVSTALMAVLAAISSLEAGHHSNEAMIAQINSTDKWAYYEAKGIKSEITENMMQNSKGDDSAKLAEKIVKYKKEQEEISKSAKEFEEESSKNLSVYKTFAMAVTFFQVAIAISAVSILTRKRFLWYFSLLLSLAGMWQLVMGFM